MVRILVNHNGIGIPKPIADIGVIEWSHAEVVTAEPEALAVAPLKMEDMTRSNAQAKAAVFEGTIEVEARVITSGVMPDPLSVIVDVGSVWMAGPVP